MYQVSLCVCVCVYIYYLFIYFSPYTGTTYTVSSGNCPSFSCATSSSLLMLTAGPVSKMGSQQEKFFCLLRFKVSRSVITVQREFRAPFRKDAWCIFSKPCTKLTLHCNHSSGQLKMQHTESLFLLRRHLGNWPRSKHEKRTAGSARETWTVVAADGVRCARVRWDINFLLTFKTAPFFCVYPVGTNTHTHTHTHTQNHYFIWPTYFATWRC